MVLDLLDRAHRVVEHGFDLELLSAVVGRFLVPLARSRVQMAGHAVVIVSCGVIPP